MNMGIDLDDLGEIDAVPASVAQATFAEPEPSEPERPWEAGFFYDIPEAEYHKRTLGEANNGGLKILRDRSPAHYKAWAEGLADKKDSKALKMGRIVHCAILEYDRFTREYLLMPNFGAMQSSKNRAERDAWLKDQAPGAIIVDIEQLSTAKAMRESILRHKTARLIIENGKPEVTMRWEDDRTGLRCRSRVDWDASDTFGFAMDLKSTTNAGPSAFARDSANYGYGIQHCFYADGYRVLKKPIQNYLILAVEKDPPFAVAVYHIDAAAEERSFDVLHKSMDLLAKCKENNTWPAYSDNIETISFPGWYFSDKG
jgi:exodeoxyribonuclease VIII